MTLRPQALGRAWGPQRGGKWWLRRRGFCREEKTQAPEDFRGRVSNEKEGCDRAPGEGQAATGPGLSGVRIKSHPRPSGH